MERSKDSETVSKVGMNSSVGNLKGVLRQSKMRGLSEMKYLNQPAVLSQFSSTGSNFISPIKNRPNTIGFNEER